MKKLTKSELRKVREIEAENAWVDNLIDDTLVDCLYLESLNEDLAMRDAEAAPRCDCCNAQMRVVRDDDVTPPNGLLWGLYVPICKCWSCPCDGGQDIPQPEGMTCQFCDHAQGSCDCVPCACGLRHPRGFACDRPPLPEMPF